MAIPTGPVAVLGAGSWGTALAALIARHGFPTVLWGRDPAVIAAIDGRHENPRYLPGIPLPEGLRATTGLAAALRDAGLVLVAVPSHAFGETLRALAPLRPPHALGGKEGSRKSLPILTFLRSEIGQNLAGGHVTIFRIECGLDPLHESEGPARLAQAHRNNRAASGLSIVNEALALEE